MQTHGVFHRNRRQHPRKVVRLDVIVHVGSGGAPLKGTSLDLSRSGAFLRLRSPVAAGQRVDVFIAPKDDVSGPILVGGTVIRSMDRGVGVAFSHSSEQVLRRVEQVVTNAP